MPKVFYRKWEWYTELMSVVEQFSDHFPDVESTKFVQFFFLPSHSPDDARAMVLTSEQYEIFKTASARFLVEAEFGFPQTEAAMSTVFGLDRSSMEAQIWKTYWADLGSEEEKRKDGKEFNLVQNLWRYSPVTSLIIECSRFCLPSKALFRMSKWAARIAVYLGVSPCSPMLRSLLVKRTERAERKQNGNKHGKEKKGLGRCDKDRDATT
ncbi:hypothetical protein B0H11DRAFT_1898177 [Mycena galericulata]|nr:hypothetical protein B0H11DRAFT_1898177 [Mycena galericulata]